VCAARPAPLARALNYGKVMHDLLRLHAVAATYTGQTMRWTTEMELSMRASMPARIVSGRGY
jgi:hypothetical protein